MSPSPAINIHMSEVEEEIEKGFADEQLDAKDREVLLLVNKFLEEEGAEARQAEQVVRRKGLPDEVRPLVDFALSFGGESSGEIVDLHDPAIRGVPGHEAFAASAEAGARKGIGYLILREFHRAICQGDPRYADDVEQLSKNSKPIILAVAGGIAVSVGLLASVVTALTASALWFIAKIGVNTFCQYYSSFYEPGPEATPTSPG